MQNGAQNKFHRQYHGLPSQFGFKDVTYIRKVEKFEPERPVARYKHVGEQYFVALGNDHDNFDLWNSQYQPWNSRVEHQRDLIGAWAAAAHHYGLPIWCQRPYRARLEWDEIAQAADMDRPLTGVPYDGKLTAVDGLGKRWNGLFPQDLYSKCHPPSPNFGSAVSIHARWDWNNSAILQDHAYWGKYYSRTVDFIHHYHPDWFYFNDDALPLWPASDAGLKIAAEFYNFSPWQILRQCRRISHGLTCQGRQGHCRR